MHSVSQVCGHRSDGHFSLFHEQNQTKINKKTPKQNVYVCCSVFAKTNETKTKTTRRVCIYSTTHVCVCVCIQKLRQKDIAVCVCVCDAVLRQRVETETECVNVCVCI